MRTSETIPLENTKLDRDFPHIFINSNLTRYNKLFNADYLHHFNILGGSIAQTNTCISAWLPFGSYLAVTGVCQNVAIVEEPPW